MYSYVYGGKKVPELQNHFSPPEKMYHTPRRATNILSTKLTGISPSTRTQGSHEDLQICVVSDSCCTADGDAQRTHAGVERALIICSSCRTMPVVRCTLQQGWFRLCIDSTTVGDAINSRESRPAHPCIHRTRS